MEAFIYGMFLAFGLILPLGVQNLFVFNQGAVQPTFLKVLPVVLTASLCDTLLILMAVEGVSVFIASYSLLKGIMIICGAAFLIYMGFITWGSAAASGNGEETKVFSGKQQVVFAASVSLLNPHAIMDTIGVIGTSSLNYQGNEKMLFTSACIFVSWLWFISLAIVGRVIGRQKQFGGGLILLNKVSAVFIWGSAAYLVYSTLYLQ